MDKVMGITAEELTPYFTPNTSNEKLNMLAKNLMADKQQIYEEQKQRVSDLDKIKESHQALTEFLKVAPHPSKDYQSYFLSHYDSEEWREQHLKLQLDETIEACHQAISNILRYAECLSPDDFIKRRKLPVNSNEPSINFIKITLVRIKLLEIEPQNEIKLFDYLINGYLKSQSSYTPEKRNELIKRLLSKAKKTHIQTTSYLRGVCFP